MCKADEGNEIKISERSSITECNICGAVGTMEPINDLWCSQCGSKRTGDGRNIPIYDGGPDNLTNAIKIIQDTANKTGHTFNFAPRE
tara:strand:- start:178 stop:438 length:261 start_codon:yes stop_codon:yes gene_type:complete